MHVHFSCSEEALPSKKSKIMEPEKPSAKYILSHLSKLFHRAMTEMFHCQIHFLCQKIIGLMWQLAAVLEAGQMTTDTESAFFSSLASAIFKYKKMPTTEDSIDVASGITDKYPFLKATSGRPM